MRKLILSVALVAATLTGCAGLNEREQRIGSGAVIGGAAGNLLGGGTIGTVGGAVLGGLVGAEVDRNRNDKRLEQQRNQYDNCRRYNPRHYCDNSRY